MDHFLDRTARLFATSVSRRSALRNLLKLAAATLVVVAPRTAEAQAGPCAVCQNNGDCMSNNCVALSLGEENKRCCAPGTNRCGNSTSCCAASLCVNGACSGTCSPPACCTV
jgi:hypothetical protein